MPANSVDVAIIGAGPYGLSLAAHLKDRRIEFRIFGWPMQTWYEMPRGLYLKSMGFATNIYTTDGRLGFVSYSQERGLEANEPCAIADFTLYGVWAQEQLVPELEKVAVANVSRDGNGYNLTLNNGEILHAKQVIVAVGLKYFAYLPNEIASLPIDLASHTSQHRDYRAFADKDVCVVGAGQSALEAAHLLREAGARPQLLVRGSRVEFAKRTPSHRNWWQRIRRPQSGLGPGLKGWVLESMPLFAHFMPARLRLPFVKRHLGPLGAWWLCDDIVGKVPFFTNCTILQAVPQARRLLLRVSEKDVGEREIVCDHVIAGTGYEVDVDRLQFLDLNLRKSIRRVELGPALDFRFQSSVPGLYFIGLASSLSFGPMFRFVLGADYTSRALSCELARRSVQKIKRARYGALRTEEASG